MLVPTRELAAQVGGVMESLARPAGMDVLVVYGGVGYQPQIDALRRGVQIVVGTPGRVLDHLQRGALKLDALEVLVLDEADQMLDKGFAPDVERIIRRTPQERQTALFSATTPDWVKNVAAKYLYEPQYVSIGKTRSPSPKSSTRVIEVWDGNKMNVLLALLTQPAEGATLVFGRTRHGVINLAKRLQKLGFEVEALQGDLGQPARDRIVKRFREGRLPILLATNVAARGPRHAEHRTRDQLRPAGNRRAVRPPRRPYRSHGPLRPGDHVDRGNRPAEAARDRAPPWAQAAAHRRAGAWPHAGRGDRCKPVPPDSYEPRCGRSERSTPPSAPLQR